MAMEEIVMSLFDPFVLTSSFLNSHVPPVYSHEEGGLMTQADGDFVELFARCPRNSAVIFSDVRNKKIEPGLFARGYQPEVYSRYISSEEFFSSTSIRFALSPSLI